LEKEKCLEGEKEMFKWLRDIFVPKEEDMKKKLDVNQDGKVDLKDVAEAAKKVEEKVEQVAAPVVAEVKETAQKVKATVKSKAVKAKSKK